MTVPIKLRNYLVFHQTTASASKERKHPGFLGSSFLAAVAVFFFSQLPLRYFESELLSLEATNYYFVSQSVLTDGVRASIVCLGDSLLKQGIAPIILEKYLHERAINLAVIGSRPMATYCIFKRILREGGQPKLVLVDFEPCILYSEPSTAAHESAEFYDADDFLDVALAVGDGCYTSSLLLSILLPSYRLKHAISDLAISLVRTGSWPDRSLVRKYSRNWRINKGQSLEPAQNGPLPGNTIQASRIVGEWRKVFQDYSSKNCNQVNLAFMRKFFDLANRNSIKVFWLITPMHPRAQKEMEETGFETAYTNLVRNMQSQFPNLIVIDGRHANYDGHLFIDSEHFHRHGATIYSKSVAEILRLPASTRWIQLPKCDMSDVDMTLEDVEQSSKSLLVGNKRDQKIEQ